MILNRGNKHQPYVEVRNCFAHCMNEYWTEANFNIVFIAMVLNGSPPLSFCFETRTLLYKRIGTLIDRIGYCDYGNIVERVITMSS